MSALNCLPFTGPKEAKIESGMPASKAEERARREEENRKAEKMVTDAVTILRDGAS